MLSMKSITASLSLVAITSANVFAQTEENTLQEIVVIANRVPVPISQIATSISIIDREDIQAHGNFSLTDVLRQSAKTMLKADGPTSFGGCCSR